MSEVNSPVSVVEKPEVPVKKPSLRQKIVARFRRGDQTSREVLEQLAQDPSLETAEPKETIEEITQDATESDKPERIDTEKIYAQEVDELHRKEAEDPFRQKNLKAKAEGLRREYKTSKNVNETRVFTEDDIKRHERLVELAQQKKVGLKGGLKNPAQFLKLIEFMESEVMLTDYQHEEFDHEPSKEAVLEAENKWKELGFGSFDLRKDYHDPTKWILSHSRHVPYNVSEDQVDIYRQFVNSVRDPVGAIKGLNKIGGLSLHDIAYGNSKHQSSSLKAALDILPSRNVGELMVLLGNIDNLARPKEFEGYHDTNKKTYSAIKNFAKSSEVAGYTSEIIDRINLLSNTVYGWRIEVEDLPHYKDAVSDPETFAFLANSVLSGKLGYSRENMLGNLNALKEDNLLKPLTVLLDSGIAVDFNFSDKDLSQPRELLKIVNGVDVQTFLQNKEMQDFAHLVHELIGTRLKVEEVVVAFSRKAEIVTFLRSISSEEQRKIWKDDEYPRSTPLARTDNFLSDKSRSEAVFDPQFQEFIAGLKDQGFTFIASDYLHLYKYDTYNKNQEIKSLPVELYKMRGVLELAEWRGVEKIIDGLRKNDYSDEYKSAIWKLTKYSEIFQKAVDERPSLLEKLGQYSSMDTSKFADKEYYVLAFFDDFPEDYLKHALESDTQFPSITSEKIGRYNLMRENFGGRILSPELFNEIINSDEEIINNGEHTKAFVDILIRHNLLTIELLSENIISQYEPDQQRVLRLLKDLPSTLHYRFINEQFFPELSENRLKAYKTLKEVHEFGKLGYMPSILVDKIVNSEDPQIYFRSGKPTRLLIDSMIKSKIYNNLPNFLTSDVLAQYDDAERSVLAVWRSLPDDLKTEVIKEAPDFPNVPSEKAEKYSVVRQILDFSKMHNVNPLILEIDLSVLKEIPEKCPWFSASENSTIAQQIFNNPELYLHNDSDLNFINQVFALAGENSLAIFKDYKRYIDEKAIIPDERSLFVDFAHVFKDPQSTRDSALRIGHRMMGDYLTVDSYRFLKGVVNGSVSDEALQGMGITQKGEEGLVQLESTMRGFILGLGSGDSDLSLLEHKIFSDFLKSYVRYEVSAWGNHNSDNFSRIVQTLQRIKESKPEVLTSDLQSSGIQEIAKIERSKTNDSTFTDSFLSRYSTFTDNIQKALDAINQPRAFSGIARNIKAKIDEQVLELERDLEKNKDKPQAQIHIQKRIDKLKTVNPGDVKSFQANFSALAQEKVFNDLLMQSVFAYTLQKFPEQRERMAQAIGKESPDVDSISAVLDFTEHMTTKEAWRSYFTDKNAKRAFQNILDTKEINDGLSRLLDEGGKSRSNTPVEFVPTRGILMEFSGYIADACWASRYESSAEQFPNITAVMMQDVSKDVPKLLGSSLLIETTSTDGVPLLVIRGLNPLESYINHVDIPDFYGKFTDYVKRLAKDTGRKAAIVIDNHSGGAATNRPLLFNFLQEQKNNLTSVGLLAEDTTFNGYNITNNTYLLSA